MKAPHDRNPPFFRSLRFRYGLGLAFFLAVGGYFLWVEHEAHIMENAGLILILATCVGMHLFMHGGHGHGKSHGGNQTHDKDEDAEG